HLVDPVVVGLVVKLQGDQPGVCQVGAVNPGVGLGGHGLYPQVQGSQGGVLPGGTLPVVGAADDNAAPLLLAAGGEVRIAHGKAELGDLGDVGPEGEDLGPGGHDVVGGDVVAHLQDCLLLDALRQGLGGGEGLDVGAPLDLHLVH